LCVLIAIEGIDGSGKGTQAARLHSYYLKQNLRVALLSFPRYQQTAFGRKIGDFLNGKFGNLESVHPLLVSLLFAGDRFESRDLIRQTLANHDIVICDRYIASNIAHQGAKVAASERQELMDWIHHLESTIYQLPPAQLTLFLDIPVENAQQLIAAKSQRSYTDKAADLQEADGHYLQRVREVYLQLASSPGWKCIPCVEDHKVRPINKITADIIAAVNSFLSAPN
jgi:dTMP kinase